MPSSSFERIGALVRRGILLFSQTVPIPAAPLIAAVSAAAITKILELRERKVSEILGIQLELQHVPFIEPDDAELLRFYTENPLYPELASQFSVEISANDLQRLRTFYPYIYGTLILRRQIPQLLFHQEIAQKQYRKMAEQYQELSQGFHGIEGNVEMQNKIDSFGLELLEVLNAIYDAAKKELITDKNQLAFDLIDYIRDVATT